MLSEFFVLLFCSLLCIAASDKSVPVPTEEELTKAGQVLRLSESQINDLVRAVNDTLSNDVKAHKPIKFCHSFSGESIRVDVEKDSTTAPGTLAAAWNDAKKLSADEQYQFWVYAGRLTHQTSTEYQLNALINICILNPETFGPLTADPTE